VVVEGEDGTRSAELEGLMERAGGQGRFGCVSWDWAEYGAEVPRQLGAKEFEDWLWREI
jgi:hypothetical protein